MPVRSTSSNALSKHAHIEVDEQADGEFAGARYVTTGLRERAPAVERGRGESRECVRRSYRGDASGVVYPSLIDGLGEVGGERRRRLDDERVEENAEQFILEEWPSGLRHRF